MGDHDFPGTCLSSNPQHQLGHEGDVLLHYFGCLKRTDRKKFYDSLNVDQKLRVREEHRRILEHRALFEARDDGLVRLLTTSISMLRQSTKFKNLQHQGPAEDSIEQGPESSAPSPPYRYGLNANMIFFKDSKQYTDRDYPDEFPNQKIPLDQLLYSKDNARNPLMKGCPKNMIRYFHLPANNMSWAEEAIARLYNEEVPDYENIFRRPDIFQSPEHPTKTYMMLRPEFWRGQQRGDQKDAVHARHMRPLCNIISTDPNSVEDSTKNLVLFMPYLHWETDRRRSKFDEIIQDITEEYKEREDKRLPKARLKAAAVAAVTVTNQNGKSEAVISQPRTAKRQSLWPCGKRKEDEDALKRPQTNASIPKSFRPMHTFNDVVEAKVKATMKRPLAEIKENLVQTIMPYTVLGRVFLRAAILYEAMECYYDQELLRDNLYKTPPLHPRRTLDQSYYWTLKTTKKRDRDQVVYRGTAPQKEFMHHHGCKKEKEHCDHHHCNWTKEEGCDQCQHDIRKVARVVMVDQLWLWILDGNTIITCFPNRWGRNKPDPSAVHKSLRLRLKAVRKDEIRSVYDLALIIIDQCSRVFFDYTKIAHRQPRVMDLFANAIGDVANKQTIAYEHFWYCTQKATEIYKSRDVDTSGMTKALLDINPEGKLLCEIKDILDELNIMIQIKKHQERVLAEFVKHANHISEEIQGNLEEKVKSKRAKWWRKEHAHEIENRLKDRVADLNNIKEMAEDAEKALDGLLGLKQQQASVLNAREQTEQTLQQGRTIMMFTVITIIFLPLTFFTGVYGMNNIQFNNGNYDLYTQLSYMLPVSIGVIVASLVLASSSFVRALLFFIFSISGTYFVTSTRIDRLWIEFKTDSQSLAETRKKYIRSMKEKATRERQGRHERKMDENGDRVV